MMCIYIYIYMMCIYDVYMYDIYIYIYMKWSSFIQYCSSNLQLLTFVRKVTILDAAGVPGVPMPKVRRVEQNVYG